MTGSAKQMAWVADIRKEMMDCINSMRGEIEKWTEKGCTDAEKCTGYTLGVVDLLADLMPRLLDSIPYASEVIDNRNQYTWDYTRRVATELTRDSAKDPSLLDKFAAGVRRRIDDNDARARGKQSELEALGDLPSIPACILSQVSSLRDEPRWNNRVYGKRPGEYCVYVNNRKVEIGDDDVDAVRAVGYARDKWVDAKAAIEAKYSPRQGSRMRVQH